MSAQILELYPHTGTTRAPDGTYLAHDLHALGTPEQPLVYANFVSSLDGRIAVVEAHTGESYVLGGSHEQSRLAAVPGAAVQAQADCTDRFSANSFKCFSSRHEGGKTSRSFFPRVRHSICVNCRAAVDNNQPRAR